MAHFCAFETKNGTSLVNYSYLVDGTKLSALKDSGEGLVYRGPFVYRKSAGPGNSSLTLESAAFGGGRLTPSRAMLYVTDYLGSVRAVVDGQSGELYKASDYSAFGEENDVVVPQHAIIPTTQLATATLPDGTTIRDSYTGKEDQSLDFGTGYIDFGARQYNPSLRRWMTPDPLSEKYYGISPYAFCNNNPVNLVDPDGRKVKPKGIKELMMIRNTLPIDSHRYVQLTKDGYIDAELLSYYNGVSDNCSSLLQLVQANTVVDVILDNQYEYLNRNGELCESPQMSYFPPDEQFMDTSFEFTSGVTTGESGNMGKTLFPDLDGEENSPDLNIKVIVNPEMSLLGAAEIFSHEAYGHALLYIRNGGDHNGASHQVSGMIDVNLTLKDMIFKSRKETVKNYNK